MNHPNFMNSDKQNILDIYKTEAREKFKTPKEDDYIRKMNQRDRQLNEPSLIKNSEYGMGYYPHRMSAKDQMIRQDHFII